MKKYLRLYGKFLAQHLKSLMEYRVDFIFGFAGFFVLQSLGIIFIYMIFQNIPSLNGWSFEQVLFIYGFSELSRGIDHLLTDNLWLLAGNMVKEGNFDRYLLRPIPPLFHLIAERFQPDGFGEITVALILMISAGIGLNLTLLWYHWILMVIVVIFGVFIFAGLKLFFASLAFWFKTSDTLLNLIYIINEYARYPINIFNKPIQILISFIIPFAFTAFFPAAFFMGKVTWQMGILGSGTAALGICSIAYFTWKHGIRHYESAGN